MNVDTSCGVPMSAEALGKYLHNLVNLFFKILPIRESGEPSLRSYMESLQRELLGCQELIVSIHNDALFTSLVSILQYLIDNGESSVAVYRQEVFKAISICNKLKARYTEPGTKEG